MDPNWVIAIIGIAAVISPVFSTWLNNKYQLKLKKLELFDKCRYKAIENFTNSVEQYYHDRDYVEATVNFESSISNLFLYFSIPNYSVFDKLKECINNNDYEKTQFAVSEIVKFLSSQIDK